MHIRLVLFISLFALFLGCTSSKNTTNTSGKLNGTWIPVQQEMGGAQLPKATYALQKLMISDTTYTFIAESVDQGIIKYQGDKMDIYGKKGVNAGKHFMAIYKYDNTELTVCYNLMGDGYPSTFETKGKPMYFLSVFKKN